MSGNRRQLSKVSKIKKSSFLEWSTVKRLVSSLVWKILQHSDVNSLPRNSIYFFHFLGVLFWRYSSFKVRYTSDGFIRNNFPNFLKYKYHCRNYSAKNRKNLKKMALQDRESSLVVILQSVAAHSKSFFSKTTFFDMSDEILTKVPSTGKYLTSDFQ